MDEQKPSKEEIQRLRKERKELKKAKAKEKAEKITLERRDDVNWWKTQREKNRSLYVATVPTGLESVLEKEVQCKLNVVESDFISRMGKMIFSLDSNQSPFVLQSADKLSILCAVLAGMLIKYSKFFL